MNENQKKQNQIKQARGRGSVSNQTGRFNRLQMNYDLSDAGYIEDDDVPVLKTEYFKDNAKSIINQYDSPDLGFGYSLNPYRGCEHGCIYCYARPTHEYFNLSAGLDFESKIFIKEQAPQLLKAELMKSKWKPEVIMISGVTDCYQPIERKLQITRQCLQVLTEFKNPFFIITKNFLVTRDVDILAQAARDSLVGVCVSVTTLDEQLARKMEPRTSSPQLRLKAIQTLSESDVPVIVNIAPIVPGLTDHEIPQIMKAAADAGARSAGYVALRLPHSVKDLFTEWLEKNYPEKKEKVLSAVRDIRGGKLYNADFETRMRGTGAKADHLEEMFKVFKKKYFSNKARFNLRTDLFKRPTDQMSFLD